MWLPILAGVQASGLNVLAFDYRGYGRSTGSPTEKGLYRDADAVLAELARLRQRESAGRHHRAPPDHLLGPIARAARWPPTRRP